jgi:hypothetical protein
MVYMEATESLKYPYLITRDTNPSRAVLEVFKFSPSDGCPVTAPCLASTQALQSDACPPLRRLRTASSHTGQTGAPHRSDRYPPVRPVRPTGQTGLELLQHRLRFRSWLCGSTKEFSGFLVSHWKPCELGVASANRHS